MRARESCRPSALPLKVGRKPKLTSNKVFEVVRGGSWGTCVLREGRLAERSCQLLLFDARWLSRTQRAGACSRQRTGWGQTWPASLRKADLGQRREPDTGALVTLFVGPEACNHLLSALSGERGNPKLFSVIPLLLCRARVDGWTSVWAIMGVKRVKGQKSEKVDLGMKITFHYGVWAKISLKVITLSLLF